MEVRDWLGIEQGSTVEFSENEHGEIIVRRLKLYTADEIRDELRAMSPTGPKNLTNEEIDAAIAAGMKKKYARR